VQSLDERETILTEAKTVAVVGLSPNPERESHRIALYLKQQGYRIIPVNPQAEEILGEKSYPSLQANPEPMDVVQVFRKAEMGFLVKRNGPPVISAVTVSCESKPVPTFRNSLKVSPTRMNEITTIGIPTNRARLADSHSEEIGATTPRTTPRRIEPTKIMGGGIRILHWL